MMVAGVWRDIRMWGAVFLAVIMTAACSRGQQSSPVSAPASPPSTKNLQALSAPQGLPTTLDALGRLAAATPKSAYDVTAKADELGPEVEAAFAFVRDRVRYEVYAGVLRGPRGTLMAMAGNSYDRAALLGAFLARHGRDVRYVRTRLGDDRARALVSRMFAMAAQSSRDSLPSAVQDAASAVSNGLQEFEQAIFFKWLASAAVVRGALERDKVSIGGQPHDPAQTLVTEAADHVYLEYRAADEWIPLDPTLAEARPGDRLGDRLETSAVIPPALSHRVAIRVRVERRAGDQISVEDALRYEASAADLYGTEITLTHGLLSNDPWRVVPVMQVGSEILTGDRFGDQTAGEIVGTRVGRLLGRRGPGSGEVTAIWLEFDFRYPNGQAETIRREVFDRIGLPARMEGKQTTAALASLATVMGIPAPLLQAYGLSLASGIVYPGFGGGELSRHSSDIAAAQNVLSSRGQRGGDFTEEEVMRVVQALTPAVPAALNALAQSFHTLSTAALPFSSGNDSHLYAPSPRLAIASIGFTIAADGGAITPSLSIDLRRNALRAVTERSPAPSAIWANIRRGLYDGVLEHVLVDGGAGQGGPRHDSPSAVGVIDEARRRGTDVLAVTQSAALQKLHASDAVKARMRAGLGDGVVLVAPAQAVSVNGAARLGWWRIDLRSGEALAIMDNGLHTSSFEQQMIKRKQAEKTLWALYEKWVVSFFGGNPVHAELARAYGMAFYQMGRHAGAGPSPWPAIISFSGLAGVIAFLLGWWARGTQVPPPPPPAPPRSQ